MRAQCKYKTLSEWICNLILFFHLISRLKYFMKFTENLHYQMNLASTQGLLCSQNCNFAISCNNKSPEFIQHREERLVKECQKQNETSNQSQRCCSKWLKHYDKFLISLKTQYFTHFVVFLWTLDFLNTYFYTSLNYVIVCCRWCKRRCHSSCFWCKWKTRIWQQKKFSELENNVPGNKSQSLLSTWFLIYCLNRT